MGTQVDVDELRGAIQRALALKAVVRSGWLRVGVRSPESVASHSWGVSFLVLTLAPRGEGFDLERALSIAILHDAAEAVTGDITPHDGIDRAEKERLEAEALGSLVAALPPREELLKLWWEFEEGSTREARFVRACDKLDMALQAHRYAGELGVPTAEFIDSALEVLDDGLLRALARESRGLDGKG